MCAGHRMMLRRYVYQNLLSVFPVIWPPNDGRRHYYYSFYILPLCFLFSFLSSRHLMSELTVQPAPELYRLLGPRLDLNSLGHLTDHSSRFYRDQKVY